MFGMGSDSDRNPDFERRELVEDLDFWVHYFLEESSRASARALHGMTEAFAAILESYDWPGGLKELKEVLSTAARSAQGPFLEVSHLPAGFPWGRVNRFSA